MVTRVSTLLLIQRISRFFEKYLIPLGFLILLISMFIAGDRGRVHQLFYVFLALPTFIFVVMQPHRLKNLVYNPLFLCFCMFSTYMMITLAWSPTEDSALSLIRRPLYIALLFIATGTIGFSSIKNLEKLTYISAIVAALAAALSLGYFLTIRIPHSGMRLEGYGALYNPLLSAHVFGAFATVWLASWLQGKSLQNPVAIFCFMILIATLLATGSRTPWIGLAAALAWLLATGNKKRSLKILSIIFISVTAILVLHPETLTQRGVSFRPQIWLEAISQIKNNLWFGHGYDADVMITVPGLDMILADPHNMELGVLYAGGVVGLGLWIMLYSVAYRFCWQHRAIPAVNMAAAWLTFGIGSGLTEGMAFMSRPKEHWFLIWIPMALIYGQWIANSFKKARTTSGDL